MPKIERSVDYTFEAYSGADEQEDNNEDEPIVKMQENESTTATVDEESEMDETSKFFL